jgi:hypothetical protein
MSGGVVLHQALMSMRGVGVMMVRFVITRAVKLPYGR